MNKVIEAMLTRRSIRGFKEEQLSDEVVDQLLQCAIHAPSSNNMQNWHFTVIQNKELISHMDARVRELINQNPQATRKVDFNIFYDAPTVIVVSGEKGSRPALINCSAATQNILLAAHSLGAGSCWIGMAGLLFGHSEEVEKMGVPEGYEPVFMISLGYPREDYSPRDIERKKDVVSYIK